MFPQSRISVLIACCLIGFACSPSSSLARTKIAQEQTAQLESVSGRIASVQGNTFTLQSQQSKDSTAAARQVNSNEVMTFTVDQSTTVEGKIEVGANADVTFREQDGNNIAVSVRVSAPQS